VTPLQTPSQAAPSGIAVTASSVSSPNSVPNTPSVTASSVTSPNASVSSPSAVSSVSSPSASSNVAVVSSVTPPISSVKPVGSVTVKPFAPTINGNTSQLLETALAKDLCDKKELNELQNAAAQGNESGMVTFMYECALKGYADLYSNRLDSKILDSLLKDLKDFNIDLRANILANFIWQIDGNAKDAAWSPRQQQSVLADAQKKIEAWKKLSPAERLKEIERTRLRLGNTGPDGCHGANFCMGYVDDMKQDKERARYLTRALRANNWKDLKAGDIQKALNCADKGTFLNVNLALSGEFGAGGQESFSASASLNLDINLSTGQGGLRFSSSTSGIEQGTIVFGVSAGVGVGANLSNYNPATRPSGRATTVTVNGLPATISGQLSNKGDFSFGAAVNTPRPPSISRSLNATQSSPNC
jgi:hypothetical protein